MGKSILVVEDDEDVLEFVQVALEREGYHGETSAMDACFQHLQSRVPDLVLLDIMIKPEIGREFYRQGKLREPTKAIPLPAVRGYQVHPGPRVVVLEGYSTPVYNRKGSSSRC
jgi:DNA-binding response OmpR family regulator